MPRLTFGLQSRTAQPWMDTTVLRWALATAAGLALVGLAGWPMVFIAPAAVGVGQAWVLAGQLGNRRSRAWVLGTALGGLVGFGVAVVVGAIVTIGALVLTGPPEAECGLTCTSTTGFILAMSGALAGYAVGTAQARASDARYPHRWAAWSALAGWVFAWVLLGSDLALGFLLAPTASTPEETKLDVLGGLVWGLAGAAYGLTTAVRLRWMTK